MPNKTKNTKIADKKPKNTTALQSKLFSELQRRANNHFALLVCTTMARINGMLQSERCIQLSKLEIQRRNWLVNEARENGFSDDEIVKRIARDTRARQKRHHLSAEDLAGLNMRSPDPEDNFFKL